MNTKSAPVPHEVRLVWDRDKSTFNYWCMTCNKSGLPVGEMGTALLDGERHADSWSQLPPSPWTRP